MKKIIILLLLSLALLSNDTEAQKQPKAVPGQEQNNSSRKLVHLKPGEVTSATQHMSAYISGYSNYYCGDGFYISRNRMLSLFTSLGLSAQCSAGTPPTCYGIRIYPAVNGNNIYLVFMGETYTADDTTTLITGKPYFTLKCGDNELPVPINPDDVILRITTENDIKNFQSQFGNPDFRLNSLSFSLKEYFEMLNNLDAIVAPKPDAGKYFYYIRFRPAYYEFATVRNKFYLVTTEEERTVNPANGTYTKVSYNNPGMWYNHMDPCPNMCPANKIQPLFQSNIKKKTKLKYKKTRK